MHWKGKHPRGRIQILLVIFHIRRLLIIKWRRHSKIWRWSEWKYWNLGIIWVLLRKSGRSKHIWRNRGHEGKHHWRIHLRRNIFLWLWNRLVCTFTFWFSNLLFTYFISFGGFVFYRTWVKRLAASSFSHLTLMLKMICFCWK